MMMKNFFLLIVVLGTLCFVSCSKETEQFQTAKLEDYYPLQTGKYITYQLDSLIYLAFGTRDTTVTYQVKYEIDSLIADAQGRTSYRIFRYIRKTATNAWTPNGTFMATNAGTRVEFLENNLRFTKLASPLFQGTTWKGHSFIDTYSANSTLQYLDDWDYTYSEVNVPATIGAFNLDQTLTVNQRDEIIGNPDDPGSYSEVNYGQEKYAQGIGLVYRRFFHSEFQPGNGGYFADGSYGVTYTMIDHN
jgi:hypothetical protein